MRLFVGGTTSVTLVAGVKAQAGRFSQLASGLTLSKASSALTRGMPGVLFCFGAGFYLWKGHLKTVWDQSVLQSMWGG